MSATMKRRLAKLEKRLQPARCAVPAVCWCFRDEAGELRRYDNGEPAQGLGTTEVRELPLNEFRAICADLEARV